MTIFDIEWFCLCLGLIYMITHASIFMLPRVVLASYATWLEVLLYCPACSGTWVGLFLVAANVWPIDTHRPLVDLFAGMLAGTVIGILWTVMQIRVLHDAPHKREKPLIKQLHDERWAQQHHAELDAALANGQIALDMLHAAEGSNAEEEESEARG